MKALMFYGKGDIRYESVADPIIQDPRDIIVRTVACGICGSDLHHYHGTLPSVLDGKSNRSAFGVGHEAVGEVVEIGKDVRQAKVGDTVMISASTGCGACPSCMRGDFKRCENGLLDVFGMGTSLEGCQAEAIRVPVGDFNTRQLPEGVSVDEAIILTDNLPTAYGALLGADIRPGRNACVIGLGPIGLMAVELALLMGASQVFAIDLVPERRAIAAGLGAVALHPDGAVEAVREATKGRMVDGIVEAVGSDRAMALGIELAAINGTVAALGVNSDLNFKIPFNSCINGITFKFNFFTEVSRHWDALVPLLQHNRIDPARFVTEQVPLSQGKAAYEKFDKRQGGTLKAILYPDGTKPS